MQDAEWCDSLKPYAERHGRGHGKGWLHDQDFRTGRRSRRRAHCRPAAYDVEHVHLMAGGLHLAVTPDAEIAALIRSLHDIYRVEWVAPGHCTGEPAFAALQQAYGDHYLYAGLGTVVGLGANPRSSLDNGRRHAMDQEDLRDYQEIKRRNLISFGRRTAADQEW